MDLSAASTAPIAVSSGAGRFRYRTIGPFGGSVTFKSVKDGFAVTSATPSFFILTSAVTSNVPWVRLMPLCLA
jgi:hypothetical protein